MKKRGWPQFLAAQTLGLVGRKLPRVEQNPGPQRTRSAPLRSPLSSGT